MTVPTQVQAQSFTDFTRTVELLDAGHSSATLTDCFVTGNRLTGANQYGGRLTLNAGNDIQKMMYPVAEVHVGSPG